MADPIQERIAKLSPEYRDFVLSDFPEETARTFGTPLGLDEEGIAVLENGITFHLLFFLNRREFIEFLVQECELIPAEAITIVDAIRNGLPPALIDMIDATYTSSVPVRTPDTAPQEEPQFIPTSVTYGPLSDPQQQEAQPAPTTRQQTTAQEQQNETGEAGAVQPLRTMEEDMDKIHGYGAYRKMFPDAEGGERPKGEQQNDEQVHQATSQDEVLNNKRPPLAGTPSYDKPPQQ